MSVPAHKRLFWQTCDHQAARVATAVALGWTVTEVTAEDHQAEPPADRDPARVELERILITGAPRLLADDSGDHDDHDDAFMVQELAETREFEFVHEVVRQLLASGIGRLDADDMRGIAYTAALRCDTAREHVTASRFSHRGARHA